MIINNKIAAVQRFILMSVFLCIAQNATAATVNFSSPGVAESIFDLDIGGTAYNVAFIGNVSSTDWTSQFDFTNQTDAASAAFAVATALNDAGASFFLLDGLSSQSLQTFSRVYYEADSGNINGVSMRFTGGNWVAGDLNGSFTLGTNQYPFAVDFAAVPVPAAVWLFGSALGLLGWMRQSV